MAVYDCARNWMNSYLRLLSARLRSWRARKNPPAFASNNLSARDTVHRRRRGLQHAFCLVAVVLIVGSAWVSQAYEAKISDVPVSLFDASAFPKGWTHFSAVKGSRLRGTWKSKKGRTGKDDVLICTGQPIGYLKTEELYDNFDLSMEWKYPDTPYANSGILIHTSGTDRIWPKSIQVQLHRPMAGSIFPTGGAQTANRIDVNHLKLPVNQWHKCVVSCKDGTVTVWINGKKAGEVTQCRPSSGSIALQSEGQEIHFRRIRVLRQPTGK